MRLPKISKGLAWFLGFCLFLVLLKVSYDAAMIAAAIMIVLLTLAFDSHKRWAWIPALFVAVGFVYVIRDMYSSYNVFSLKIQGLMLFPILAWFIMLMLWYLVVEPYFHHEVWWRKWFTNALLFCVGLIVFEYVGYHIFGVHLEAGKSYPGWPVLDIFHAPWWMQVAYFLNGIFFIGVVAFIDDVRRKLQSKN